MVEITKEGVLDWYKGLNASLRVELVCALLDHSLPFELRFLGSVIEHFGRKDFHILRDAENKANSLHTSLNSTPAAVAAILQILSEGPAPANNSVNPQMMSNLGENHHHHHLHHTGGHSTASPSEPLGRASPSHDLRRPTTGDTKQPQTRNHHVETGVSGVIENGLPKPTSPKPSNHPGGSRDSERTKSQELVNHEVSNSEDENGPRKELWLHEVVKRRKLILYLSLLTSTNHDSAKLYFLLLSDVQDLSENLDWLEELDELAQDEVLLLYTIGCHHPAFNFEQRTLLASVILRFKDCMDRYTKDCDPLYHQHHHPSQYNHINHQHYFPQQFIGLMQPPSVHVPSGSVTHSVVINSSTPGYGPAGPYAQPMTHGGLQTSAGSFPGFQQTTYGSVVSGVYRPNNNINQQQQQQQQQPAMINRPAVFMTNHGSVMNNQPNNLMNYSLPFSILSIPPQQLAATPNYNNKPFLNSPSNLLSKDQPKTLSVSQQNTNFAVGSSSGGDNSLMSQQQPGLSPQTTTTTISNPPRGRSYETNLPLQGNDFPVQTSVDNAVLPGLDDPIDVSCRPRRISCYNCGSNQHVGPECKEMSMEEMTKMQYRLNYGGD
ncbi:uncharacterized protein LOC110847525 isoform X2 [Folsomia candida]|uniref:Zinc finger CCHC domain-containing protein 2 n=1 Tax=Folsomia candida TaxID=158441 RepID=A0A226F6K4_FOLCA|nr:uncharacterized protein LOC110847525 isoform X2 [Folsomia candida]OXA65127.1 Zinc finger CCHC domain-containing protein 2 [Folsomia candida]